MSAHKAFDKICCVVLAVVLVITVLFMNGQSLGIETVSAVTYGYEQKLFDTSRVHTVDIVMEDWDSFIESCESEEYSVCSVVIDGEAYKNVGIRAKGNTSLSQVSSSDSDRYSFKIEFDHYDSTNTYYGLDKLCLNNMIQDNTYMKDYLTYQMMAQFGVAAPLCSYAYITVNGEDWGLYLAVEAVEDSFLQRNYGAEAGELYKPDSMSMGGGRGNGKDFDMSEWESERENISDPFEDLTDRMQNFNGSESFTDSRIKPPYGMNGNAGDFDFSALLGDEGSFDLSAITENFGDMMGKNGFSMGSDDVSLIYSDDEYDSYSNIFENVKTDITNADKDRLIAALKNINENTEIENSVDVESVIRYFVVHNFVVNFDSYTGSMIHNYYLYEEAGQLSMIPWDYNLAFGGFMSSSDATSLVNYPIDTPVSGGDVESRPMLAWIFESEEYTELYHELFAEFLSEIDIVGIIESAYELIAPYVENDPTAFCTYEEFTSGVQTLKEFCSLRIESIEGQLDGTIGSTDETQENDSDLIDASHINILDMGSMGNMGGGNMPNGEMLGMPNGEMPDGEMPGMPENETSSDVSSSTELNSDSSLPDDTSSDEETEPPAVPDDTTSAPDGQDPFKGQMPDREGMTVSDTAQQSASFGGTERIELLVSVLILALGIVIAALFKRRKE